MTWLENYIDQNQYTVEFQTELSIIDLNEKIIAKMAEKKVNRVELAKRLGVSKAFITKLLNGNPNMTIKTINALALALDCQVYLDFKPKGFKLARPPIFVHDNKNYTAYVPPVAEEVLHACAA
jgi:transcriptional regulator with XRE-family HTH domain